MYLLAYIRLQDKAETYQNIDFMTFGLQNVENVEQFIINRLMV